MTSGAFLKYLTTDPEALGVLAWVSALITVLGFAVAIWQIVRAKRAADAARDAALGMVQRVGSRELLAKLGEADAHLEAARSHFANGDREATLLRFSFVASAVIEALEISRMLTRAYSELATLGIVIEQLIEEVTRMTEPLDGHPDFVELRIRMQRVSQLLRANIAQSRYDYSLNGD